jgi:hypothetical protein
VRRDVEEHILAFVEAAAIGDDAIDQPLFRSTLRRAKQLTANPRASKTVCELVKRRWKDAGLPIPPSPYSFRARRITDLESQGMLLEDVHRLAEHADRRTTAIQDRRQKKATPDLLDRVSIRGIITCKRSAFFSMRLFDGRLAAELLSSSICRLDPERLLILCIRTLIVGFIFTR